MARVLRVLGCSAGRAFERRLQCAPVKHRGRTTALRDHMPHGRCATITKCWDGTVTSERLPVMRRIAEQLTEPDEMTYENSFGARPRASSRVSDASRARQLAEEVVGRVRGVATRPARVVAGEGS
jgi:hypothetical protein